MSRILRRAIYPISVLAFALGLTSCQQRLYFPERANAPGLTDGGQLQAIVSVKAQTRDQSDSTQKGGNLFSPGFDIALSPFRHFGLIGSYRVLNNKQIDEKNLAFDDRYGGIFNGSRWEVGAGYYNLNMGDNLFEIYAGMGQGSTNREGKRYPTRDYEAQYTRYFVQPSMGRKSRRGWICQGGFTMFAQTVTSINGRSPDIRYQVPGGKTPYSWYWVPYLNLNIPASIFLLNAQAGYSVCFWGPDKGVSVPFYGTVGVGVQLGKLQWSRLLTRKATQSDNNGLPPTNANIVQ